jgi:hypothetical protein
MRCNSGSRKARRDVQRCAAIRDIGRVTVERIQPDELMARELHI